LAFAKHKDGILAGNRVDKPTHGKPLRHARLERTETQQAFSGLRRRTLIQKNIVEATIPHTLLH
jgi:hypothetical protein